MMNHFKSNNMKISRYNIPKSIFIDKGGHNSDDYVKKRIALNFIHSLTTEELERLFDFTKTEDEHNFQYSAKLKKNLFK